MYLLLNIHRFMCMYGAGAWQQDAHRSWQGERQRVRRRVGEGGCRKHDPAQQNTTSTRHAGIAGRHGGSLGGQL